MSGKHSLDNNLDFTDGNISVGIIGGYGIVKSINVKKTINIKTPYGESSHPIIIGEMENTNVAFISRHGKNHEIPSHSVNYRANVFALKKFGVQKIVSAIAAGSLNKSMCPGDIAIPLDFIDNTKNRRDTFFDGNPVHHFSSIYPFCSKLRDIAKREALNFDFKVHSDAIAIIIEGPRFSTTTESILYQKMGADIINMSLYPEVILARELGICYVNIALITDYDAGCISGISADPVTLEMIDNVQDRYKDRCTKLITNIISEAQEINCDICSSHVEAARKKVEEGN